ncbi:MAG TPA: alpha/beta fold hydrolase [Thermoanaerobaculia bacterium]|nr:alpha/beta fold hydrolase [Thermoanaerobaculia bacterium]
MPFVAAPPLPPFLAAEMPFDRAAYRLEDGPDAGRRLHFVDHGPRSARPVLMLHGNPTWSFLWRKVIRRLPELRCVAPDLLGLGLSDTLGTAEHSVDRHARAIAELVEALDLTGVVLVGQDWGGPIGAAAAAWSPERIAGLVLGNTSVLVPERPHGTAFHRFSHRPVISDVAFRLLGFPLHSLHRIQGDPRSLRGATAAAYRWPLRGWRRRAAPLALARMVPDSREHPSLPALLRGETWARSFDGPMALVWGERDPVLGRALKWHREVFPAAEVTVTEAGHFLQEEVPDEIAAAVGRVGERAGAA